MDGSFSNQVLARMDLWARKFAGFDPKLKQAALKVEVLPRSLDEEVAACMVQGFRGVIMKLTKQQADSIGVSPKGPFKSDSYKY